MTQLRTFIAIDLPQSIQNSISKETARLQKILGNEIIRWIQIPNIHITLKFLGNIPHTHIDFLKQILIKTADSNSAFDLQVQSIGSFPDTSTRLSASLKLPRVIWLGVQSSAGLMSVQKNVESAVTQLGYEKEARKFSPHLTLGRVRQNLHPNDLQKIREALTNFQLGKIDPARVDSLHLYQSDLHSEGSVYTKLFSVKLS